MSRKKGLKKGSYLAEKMQQMLCCCTKDRPCKIDCVVCLNQCPGQKRHGADKQIVVNSLAGE